MNISSPFSPTSAQAEPELGCAVDGRAFSGMTVPADALAQQTPTPCHSPVLMHAFLKALDSTATRFTFQLFRDPKHRKNEPHPRGLRLIHHCTADEACAFTTEWNTPEHGYGVYVTINATDFGGRKRENVIRVRAVCGDADNNLPELAARLKGLLPPSAIVQSSRGRAQFYWWVDDTFPLGDFERIQRALIAKLGTDPQVHDLPRVMRVPGTLHLKRAPQLVKLKLGSPARYSLKEIVEGLELLPSRGTTTLPVSLPPNTTAFPVRPPLPGISELAAGISGLILTSRRHALLVANLQREVSWTAEKDG
jgi:hypothetical protein